MPSHETEPSDEIMTILRAFAIEHGYLSASVSWPDGEYVNFTTASSPGLPRCALGRIMMDAAMTMMLKCNSCEHCRPLFAVIGADVMTGMEKLLREGTDPQ